MIEIWKHIAGYEGLYKVSSEGRVMRCDKYPGRVLKYGHTVQGRRQVSLCRNGVAIKCRVHVLVCTAFNGPCPPGLECRHGDGDHLNNRPYNLSWATHAVNMGDTVKHGTSRPGEASPMAKLTADDVKAIRTSQQTQRALAAAYGVTAPAILAIQKRRTWAHVQ